MIKATLQSGQLIGTFPYMAPEQFSTNFGKLDVRTDIWVLGVVFHEMLTGEYPITVSEDDSMNPFEWRDAVITNQPYVGKAPLRKGLPDIFVHVSTLIDAKSLKQGERVLFELEERGGKPQAKNVERFRNP